MANAGDRRSQHLRAQVRHGSASPEEARAYLQSQNYAYHDPDVKGEYEVRVEVVCGKKASHYEGKISGTGKPSNQVVCEFDFSGLSPAAAEAVYASYGDSAILSQWQAVLPPENILVIDDSKAVVDAMLG